MTLERVSIDGPPIVQTLSDKQKNNIKPDLASSSGFIPPKNDGTAKLQRAETKVLSMEQALRARGGRYVSSVFYRYLTGPDGKKYIVGAEVSISAPMDVMEDLGLAVGSFPDRLAAAKADKAYGSDSKIRKLNRNSDGLSAREKLVVDELSRTDREVKAHEAAHQRAGAPYAGMATYRYVTGPDNKKYAVAGQVPISVSISGSPEDTVRAMDKVRASALSPASPSGKDLQVAAEAASVAARARRAIARREARRAYRFVRPDHGSVLSMVA